MNSSHTLRRRDVVRKLLESRGDTLVVTGLGSSTWDVYAESDGPLNFYLWGAMGNAVMVGLGIAIAQPNRQVVVITGDGEMLMGLGSLATVGVQRPANLAVIVLDNEHYGETGMQESHTSFNTDLAAVARANGIESASTVSSMDEVEVLANEIHTGGGSRFVCIKVSAAEDAKALPTRDGVDIKNVFRRAVLGQA